MSPRVRTVLDLVSEMTPDERAELREKLAEAVSDDEWTAAGNDELTRRVAQMDSLSAIDRLRGAPPSDERLSTSEVAELRRLADGAFASHHDVRERIAARKR
jgi:uncharacterized tellurite resistance protein B-like protein